MTTEKGHCKHGEFLLAEGCTQCIAERRQSGVRPEQDEMEDGLNNEGLTLISTHQPYHLAGSTIVPSVTHEVIDWVLFFYVVCVSYPLL